MANDGSSAACARLAESDPGDGAVVWTSPAQVVLTFNETVTPEFVTVTVTASCGAQCPLDPPRVAGATVTQPLPQLGPDQYAVGYRVVSGGGHPIDGRIALTVKPGGSVTVAPPVTVAPRTAASAPPTVASQEPARCRAWPFIVGSVVLIAAVVVTAVRPSSRRWLSGACRRADVHGGPIQP